MASLACILCNVCTQCMKEFSENYTFFKLHEVVWQVPVDLVILVDSPGHFRDGYTGRVGALHRSHTSLFCLHQFTSFPRDIRLWQTIRPLKTTAQCEFLSLSAMRSISSMN